MSKLKKRYLILIMVVLFIIPTSFAAQDNITDADTIGIDESYNIYQIDNHVGDEGYIEFEYDKYEVEEGESITVEGALYWYEDMECWDDLNLICTYEDANGIKRTCEVAYRPMDTYGFQFDTSQCVGLEKRNEPYIFNFTAVEDDDYDTYLMYSDGFSPSWFELYYGAHVPVGPIIPTEPTIVGTLYVDCKNGNDSNDGSVNSPFETISKALDRNLELGGNYEIIVNEGEYDLINYQNSQQNSGSSSFVMRGNGTVKIYSDETHYHMLIGGTKNYIIYLIGLTFTKGGNSAIVTSSVYGGSGNLGNELIITNCTFIDNSGYNGAVRSFAKTIITNSSFIDNKASKNSGQYNGIISINDNALLVENCIFSNNQLTNTPLIYSENIPGLVDYNFWGDNDGPKNGDLSEKIIYENWTVIKISSDEENFIAGESYDINIEFKQTDGNSTENMTSYMPDFTVNLSSNNGIVPANATIRSNIATVTYTPKLKGEDKIYVLVNGKVIDTLTVNVDVPEIDKIYVSTNGSNSAIGNKDNPLRDIVQAIAKNKELGGNKTIIIQEGIYNESNMEINDTVTIIGENAIINGSESIFKISCDVEIYNLTFTNANAITHINGNLDIYDSTFENNATVISDNGTLNIYNSKFTNNEIAVNTNTKTFINNTKFEKNSLSITATNDISITNSIFDLNEKTSIYMANKSCGNIENNTFDNNLGAQSIVVSNADSVKINNNKFSTNSIAINITDSNSDNKITNNNLEKGAIHITNSTIELKNNTMNSLIYVIDSKVSSVKLTFLDNKTVITQEKENNLTAEVSDDMGNKIDGGEITFTSNEEIIGKADVINGSAHIESEFIKGDYTISGNYSSGDEYSVFTGLLRIDIDYYWFINDTGYETLKDAVDAAGINDVIKGIPGIYEEETIQIGHRTRPAEPWVINKNITITSLNETPVTLKAIDKYIFNIDYYSNVTLENLILTGANNPTGWGGAIHSMGKNTVVINNCTFINNTAEDGGAMSMWGNLYINNTLFINNTATVFGGAIYKDGDGDFYMENVKFISNHAYTYAGALYSMGYSEVTQVFRNVTFENNDATCGGAIFAHGKNMTFIDCNFTDNKAIDKGSGYDPLGGAVYAHNALTRFYNVNFINNTAEGNGGALQLDNSISSVVNSTGRHQTIYWAILENCSIIDNIALGDGGAIYSGDALRNYVNLTNVIIKNNTAYNAAGFVNLYGFYTLNNVTFEDNKNTQGDNLIYTYGMYSFPESYYSDISISDCKFINNDAKFIVKVTSEYSNLTISNSIFENESAILDNYGINSILNSNTMINPTAKYSVENQGVLALNNNTLINPVYNEGTITTPTCITVLDNDTVVADIDEKVVLKAIIEDDNHNIISGEELSFLINNTDRIKAQCINNEYLANYTVAEGTQIVSAIITDDSLKDVSIKKGTILNKNTSKMSIEVNSPILGETAIITLNMNPDATGMVNITVNDKTYSIELKNGTAVLEIPDLKVGKYNIQAYYGGNDIYGSSKVNGVLTVYKIPDYEMNYSISEVKEGEDLTINVSLPEDANGLLSVNINGTVQYTRVTNGTASISIPDLKEGTYDVTIGYLGNEKYASKSANEIVKVGKADELIITAPDVEKYYKGTERFIVHVSVNDKALAGVNVSITINDVTYNRVTDENGNASIALGIDSGTYIVSTKVNDITVNSTVTIKTTVNGSDVVKVFRNDTQYYATFRDSEGNYLAEGSEVEFNINGVFYTRTVKENGLAKLNLNLEQGNYIITAINNVTGEKSSNNITVIPRIIGNSDLIKYYRNASQYVVTLIGDDGNPVGAGETVTFNINGVFYNRTTNESGQAKLNINLEPDNYIITAEYKQCKVSNIIEVKPILFADDMNMSYQDGSHFEVKLLDGVGNPFKGEQITFNINGVFYNRTTDADGIARLNINLMRGEYIITSSYNGENIANKITIS